MSVTLGGYADRVGSDGEVRGEPVTGVQVSSPTEERNPRTISPDTLDGAGAVAAILAADAAVPTAVAACSAAIVALTARAVVALTERGRVIYVGVGTPGRSVPVPG